MSTRYLYGETNPVSAPVATATAVATGDLLGYAAGNVFTASATTWNTNLATTQSDFAAAFLGVSGQKKLANEARVFGNSTDNIIRVDCSGVYEFAAASDNYAIGDYVGPAKDAGNALVNGTLAKVDAADKAVGRVIENATGATKVKVQLLSTLNGVSR